MGLRPAHTCRTLEKKAWARFSKKKPRRSYVKAMPHLQLNVYTMGDQTKGFDTEYCLVAGHDLQVRDHALEAARQAANKYLEKLIPNQYHFRVLVFPHNVIRENKMIAGAGADRLQKGMRKAFGRATNRAARVRMGQTVFRIKMNKANLLHLKEAVRRARAKLTGEYRLKETPIAMAKPAASG